VRRDRAVTAAGPGRDAGQRAEFHDGRRPAGGDCRVGGQQRFREAVFRRRRLRAGELLPRRQPGQHAAHVGVQHRMTAAEREDGDGRGRIGADPWQGQQFLPRRRDLPAVLPGHDGGGFVQPERAPRVAQPAPLPHRLAARISGERHGRRPPL
jgi:hypothetical protein